MLGYIARRLLFMVPTLFFIMLLNFAIVQVTPGGPVEQILAGLSGAGSDGVNRRKFCLYGWIIKITFPYSS